MRDLNEDERGRVGELRVRLRDQLPRRYDTDFNLHRWILNADRITKSNKNALDVAEKNLRNHLRYRKALQLDSKPVPCMDENPMFVQRYQCKPVYDYMPSNNRYLYWMDYSTFDTVGILHTVTTTHMLVYSYYFYENMLRVVNDREAETGRQSGIYMIMDVKGYEMNPWTVMFASNGTLAQMIQVFAYEHYPELIHPYSVINTPKWLLWPLKVIRTAMPKDFNDRFHFYDNRYADSLLKHMTDEELPVQLGGTNPSSDSIQPVPSRRIETSEYYDHKATNDPPKSQLAHLQLHVGQRKLIPVKCSSGSMLSWFFSTDGDIHFGVFFHRTQVDPESMIVAAKSSSNNDSDVLDELEMQHPYFRLGAKLVPERGSIECAENGTYHIVLCNKHSWFYKRNVYLRIEIDGIPLDKKALIESAFVV